MTVLETVDLFVCLFILLTGLPSNLLAFYTFLQKAPKKLTSIEILLLNLTISDILLLLFLPFKMLEITSNEFWTLPNLFCPLTDYFLYGSVYISILFLMALGVDRYLAVAHPVKYKLKRKPVYAVAMSIFIWLLVSSHYGFIYIAKYQVSNTSLPYSSNTSHCYENFSPDYILPVRLEIGLIFFCLPFVVTLFCYVKVTRILNALPSCPTRKKQQAVGLAVVTLLSFVICFGPFNISHFVGFVQKKEPSWRVEGFILTTFNACIDPFVFYFSSKTIQQTFADCWDGACHKAQTLLPCCTWPCCQGPSDEDGEPEGGPFPTSYLQSDHQVYAPQTETSEQKAPLN